MLNLISIFCNNKYVIKKKRECKELAKKKDKKKRAQKLLISFFLKGAQSVPFYGT